MTATYTFDIFSTLDGYGSYGPDGDWGGYWGKQGPELLDRRLSLYDHSSEWSSAPIRSGKWWRSSARAPRHPAWMTGTGASA